MQLAFWNASVAPTRGRGIQSVRQAASRVRQLMSSGASLVALCEMDDASAANLEGRLGTSEVEVISACEAIGRSRWDIVVVASRAAVCCESAGSQFGRSRGNIIRSAQSFDVLTESTSLRLYVTHWRSRLTGKGFEHRRLAAETLWCAIAADLDEGTPVVVLGDFNDEPFDTPWAPLARNRSDVEPEGASGHLPLELVLA